VTIREDLQVVNEIEASELLSIPVGTLRNWRCQKKGSAIHQVSERSRSVPAPRPREVSGRDDGRDRVGSAVSESRSQGFSGCATARRRGYRQPSQTCGTSRGRNGSTVAGNIDASHGPLQFEICHVQSSTAPVSRHVRREKSATLPSLNLKVPGISRMGGRPSPCGSRVGAHFGNGQSFVWAAAAPAVKNSARTTPMSTLPTP
jgi:hypothetical protein